MGIRHFRGLERLSRRGQNDFRMVHRISRTIMRASKDQTYFTADQLLSGLNSVIVEAISSVDVPRSF